MQPADRFQLIAGGLVLVLGLLLLVTAEDTRSVASSMTSVLLGAGLLLIPWSRTRRWAKVTAISAFLVAIGFVAFGFVFG